MFYGEGKDLTCTSWQWARPALSRKCLDFLDWMRESENLFVTISTITSYIDYRLPCTPITYCHHLCPSMRQMRHDYWPYFCLASQYPAASPGTATDFAPYLALSASPLEKVMVTRNTTLIPFPENTHWNIFSWEAPGAASRASRASTRPDWASKWVRRKPPPSPIDCTL